MAFFKNKFGLRLSTTVCLHCQLTVTTNRRLAQVLSHGLFQAPRKSYDCIKTLGDEY